MTSPEPLERQLGRYPGRGLVLHVAEDGAYGWVYFITGRSPASRQRRLRRDAHRLVIEATDVGAPADVLRHYTCVRGIGEEIVIGNGDHVDQIADELVEGTPFSDVIDRIEPEPDPPIHTPRIALCLGDSATLLIVRRDSEDNVRLCLDVPPVPHTSTIVTTYDGNLEAPTGTAPIHRAEDRRNFDELTRDLWQSLDPDLRVLLVAGVGRDFRASTSLP